ncbi:MAG: exonuclease SbcCD subunit D [Thermoplasmatales archaeon]|nr:exonuclease SbcCD subunit D [Thermoplasmatales archaeon]
MKIFHVSDTHLGYSAYHKLSPDGLNQREADVYNSFEQFINYSLENKPDIIIHSGDLFDSVRPTNRAIVFAMKQLIRISDAKIPFIIISGNHETPKLRETGSILKLFEHLPYIYPVYKGKLEEIEIGEALIHAIPHCFSNEELKKNIENLKIRKNSLNILTMHVGIIGIKEFRSGDFNEQVISSGYLSEEFDYVALGHYHKGVQVTKNSYYAGSTEHFSFKEAGEIKGFYEVDLSDKLKLNFIPLKVRGMIDLGKIDCLELSADEILKEFLKRIEEHDIREKIARIELNKISREKYKMLDWEKIKNASSRAMHFEIVHEFLEIENIKGKTKIGSIEEEWKEYISQLNIKEKEDVEKLALKYLEEAKS